MKRRTLILILSLTVITFAYRATGQPPQARVEDVGVPDLRKASKNIVYIPALPMPQGWLEFARLARLNVIYLGDADDARQMQPFRGTILEFISHCAHRFNVAIWWGRHVIVVRSNVDTQRAVSPSEFLDRLPNALRASLVDEQKPWGWCPPKGERMAQMVARVLAERRKGGNADAHLLPLCLGMVSQELWAVLRRYQLLHAGTAILCMDKSHAQADDKKVRLKLSFPTLSPDEPTLPSLHDMTVGYDRFRDFLKRKGAQQPLNEFKRAVYFQALSKPPSNLSDERLRQLVSFSIAGAVPTSIAQKLSALAGIAVTFNGNDGERLWMQVENVPLRDVLEAFMVLTGSVCTKRDTHNLHIHRPQRVAEWIMYALPLPLRGAMYLTDVEKVWLQQDAVDLLWKFLTPQQKHQLVNGFIRIRELTDEQQFLCSYILALMSANALWEIYRTVSSKQVAIAQMEQYAILPPIGKRVGGPVRVRCGNFQMEFGLRLTWRILQRTQELTAGAQ